MTIRGLQKLNLQKKYKKNKKVDFVQFMRQSPLMHVKIDLKRVKSLTREIDL